MQCLCSRTRALRELQKLVTMMATCLKATRPPRGMNRFRPIGFRVIGFRAYRVEDLGWDGHYPTPEAGIDVLKGMSNLTGPHDATLNLKP